MFRAKGGGSTQALPPMSLTSVRSLPGPLLGSWSQNDRKDNTWKLVLIWFGQMALTVIVWVRAGCLTKSPAAGSDRQEGIAGNDF